jgi:serine protease
MTLPRCLRQLLVLAGLGCALASTSPLVLAAANRATQPPAVYGLIVQLHDAPSHVALAQARERAFALGAGAQANAYMNEAARWQRLLSGVRADGEVLRELPQWAAAAPQRDPVGASAQVLRFARPLTAEQAERVAARIAAQTGVASVSLNTRERRQAVALNPPADPYFAGTAGQWWLQAVAGSNAHAIDARLRGVPGFQTAWQSSSTGSAAAVVAVLDSGITCHPDLGNEGLGCIGGSILPGYDFVADWDPVAQRGYANDGDARDADPRDPGDWVSAADRSADPARYGGCEVDDSSWHGTVIASVVAAQTDNGNGVAAINWNGRVLPVRVAGKCGAEVADIIEGMRWAAGLPACKRSNGAGACAEFAPLNPNPARIVNISFGGSAPCSAVYQQAIDELRAAPFPGGQIGAVVVAAGGNGWGAPSRPANCARVIGVGALNRDGFKANYSNFGAVLALSTVGGDDEDGAWGRTLADTGILTIGNGGRTLPADCNSSAVNCYYYHFGSSFSAPIVAGAVSLMLSVNPALSVSQIERGLALSARPHVTSSVAGFGTCSDTNPGRCLCTTATCGAGILDAAQALLYAASPSTYVAPAAQAAVLDTPELRAAVAAGPDRPVNAQPAVSGSDGGGGGGAMAAAWLTGLALAALALSVLPRRRAPALRPGKARTQPPTQRY